MTPKIVVCDTGPILHLHEANALDLLSLPETTMVPRAVETELIRLIDGWALNRPEWLRICDLPVHSSRRAEVWNDSGLLHHGESEALALALQLEATWYLTDDGAAREMAKALHVEVHGSLGVVLWAAAKGHLNQEKCLAKLDALFQSSLWVSPAVQKEARAALNRIFSPS